MEVAVKKRALTLCCLGSALLLSVPWLLPHAGVVALVAFLPLLLADRMAARAGVRHFWVWHYGTFVLWNALTTFWVCHATVGGGLFAIFANAAQMSLIFGLFRFSRRRFPPVVSYIFLAAAWLAWERWYCTGAQISWPWLVLGNAFAQSTQSIQWYSITGVLGGSLWVWAVNLGFFGLLSALSDGRFRTWNAKARTAAVSALLLSVLGPLVLSGILYRQAAPASGQTLPAIVAQPNFNPYEKFSTLSQAQQTDILLSQFAEAPSGGGVLLVAPETFCHDILLPDFHASATFCRFQEFLASRPETDLLFGATTYHYTNARHAPSLLALPYGAGWLESHNSAVMTAGGGRAEVYHKSKLVVGTELTPYPGFFIPVERWLCRVFGWEPPLMGRCIGQDAPACLHLSDGTPLGCAVCYESVYAEHCAAYVRQGARVLAVITNDAWWGNTPGYRQHLSYSRLRAIETRRDIIRCGNTGISCFIDRRGDILSQTPWWTRTSLCGEAALYDGETFFVRQGDVTGRISALIFVLLSALLLVRCLVRKTEGHAV
ncbi:MAG: apolipoprotein N-acyltransferase [Bacteroidales bacterium]|nr:apolipoprotein N-acyltransferase [Bacteroidales bacterium]